MKLATTLRCPNVTTVDSLLQSFEQIICSATKAGFQVLDLNLAHYTRGASPMTEPGWEDVWKRLSDLAQKHEIVWTQGHAYFLNWELEPQSNWPEHDELVRRTIVGAGIMGVKTLVFHPKTVPSPSWYSSKESLQVNVECFRQYGEWAKPYNLTLAIENMIEKPKGRRFGSGPEELLELLEKLNDPRFAICWDTGHAHMAGINQVKALKEIGPLLKALHIADNHGEKDEHLAPLQGTIEWVPFIETLREINYTGDFSYEVLYRDHGEPYAMYELFLQKLRLLGEFLLES